MHRGAIMAFPDASGEPLARLVLERGWGAYGRTAAWLGCNPSVASADIDDPTAGRIVHHSKRANCVRALVGNVWPLRTPYPINLWPAIADGRVSREMMRANLDALAMIGAQSHVHIACFGAAPGRRYPDAVRDAIDAFTLGGRHKLYCLGTTDDGQPLHPLARGKHAVRNDAELRPWSLRGAGELSWDEVFSDKQKTGHGTYVDRS